MAISKNYSPNVILNADSAAKAFASFAGGKSVENLKLGTPRAAPDFGMR